MDGIIIRKQKHIQHCLMLFFMFGLLGLTLFTFVLCNAAEDWALSNSFLIGFAIGFAAEIIVPIVVFLILRASNKCYYIITPEHIKLYKKNKEVFVIPATAIKGIGYLGFRYSFLLQMGAGYLSVSFDEAIGDIKPTMTFPDLSMLLGIDMTEKQAQQVARILGKELR